MTKFYMTLAAVAALLALPAAPAPAFAQSPPADVAAASDTFAALDAPSETGTARKIDLQAEPIEQTGQVSEPEPQPPEQPVAAPEPAATEAIDAVADAPAGQTPEQPQTAKRICRKFSAAIAMVIEVPCESLN